MHFFQEARFAVLTRNKHLLRSEHSIIKHFLDIKCPVPHAFFICDSGIPVLCVVSAVQNIVIVNDILRVPQHIGRDLVLVVRLRAVRAFHVPDIVVAEGMRIPINIDSSCTQRFCQLRRNVGDL